MFVPFVARQLYDQICAPGGHPVGAPQPPKPRKAAVNAASPIATSGRSTDRPLNWAAIKIGSLALATTGEGEGWYEAVMVEDQKDGVLLMRWRDYPDEDVFLRRRDQLALLPVEDAKPKV